MKFCHIDSSLKDQWESLVQKNPASGFMQSFFWSEFMRKIGWTTYKIGLFENEQLIGGAVIMKKKFLWIPEGPVLPYDDPNAETYFHALISEIDAIADLKKETPATHLRIQPRLETLPRYFERFKKASYHPEPRNTLVIDLAPSEENLRAQMKPKGRQNLRVAERNNITVSENTSSKGIQIFLALYQKSIERNKLSEKHGHYFETLIPLLHRHQAGKLFFASVKNIPVAAALTVFYGNRATYLYGGFDYAYRHLMAPYKLHFEIIRHAKSLGYGWYDFYGIAPEKHQEHHPWRGLSAFKEKFNGVKKHFIGAYDFYYSAESPQFLQSEQPI